MKQVINKTHILIIFINLLLNCSINRNITKTSATKSTTTNIQNNTNTLNNITTKTITINNNLIIDTSFHSINYNSRINYIVLHYTECSTEDAFYILLGLDQTKQVSSHFIINNIQDNKYKNYLYRIVNENDKSWHAGKSAWNGNNNLNFSSIGIENVNLNGNKYEYSDKLILNLILLCKYLKQKYDILDVNILGHSDISIGRKIDPGTKFPWKKLYENGIGAWYDSLDVDFYKKTTLRLPEKNIIVDKIIKYGYNPIKPIKNIKINDDEYKNLVNAFKMHFIPNKINGEIDLDDYIILLALLKKYR